MSTSKRWYDAYQPFAEQLERLKTATVKNRDRIVAAVLEIICTDAPELLENYLMDFPLDQKKRRWYDQDPYLWLMVNGLEHAGLKLLKKVVAYMAGMEKSARETGPKVNKVRGGAKKKKQRSSRRPARITGGRAKKKVTGRKGSKS
jgi:hypothetical protein